MDLDGDRQAASRQQHRKVVGWRRIQAGHDCDRAVEASSCQQFRRAQRFHRDWTHRHDRGVGTVANALDPAQPKCPVKAGHDHGVIFAKAEVDRARDPCGREDGLPGLHVVGGRDHCHSRLGPHHRDVFERVMAESVLAVLHAATDAHHAHGQVVEERTVAYEFVGPQRRKRGNRVDEGDQSRFCQAGCQANHVLLRHPDVEEPSRKGIREGLQCHEAEVGGQQHDSRVAFRELDQGANEGLANGVSPLFPRARPRTADRPSACSASGSGSP